MKNKPHLFFAITFVLLATMTLLVASESVPKLRKLVPGMNQASHHNAAKSQAQSHCGDNPPANPAKCKIDKKFVVGCTLPFAGGESHDVDKHCPNPGCGKKPSDRAQNRIKNNLCATGTPVQISFASIDKLQKAVAKLEKKGLITYGSGATPQPAARKNLKRIATTDVNGDPVTLGEGELVTLDAFVLDAKHDDTFPFGFGGEGVNCNNSLLEWNDIHVALGQTATAPECSSVTAEIIPHFRPAVWERFDSNSCTSPHLEDPLPVDQIRVKITGQLFFDGSHRPAPCSGPKGKGNPLRRSVWEIHPVYKIEVFDKTKFISFEDWAAKQ